MSGVQVQVLVHSLHLLSGDRAGSIRVVKTLSDGTLRSISCHFKKLYFHQISLIFTKIFF